MKFSRDSNPFSVQALFSINPLTVGMIVFLACVVGILSRPLGSLATLWPANALMLALLVRFPQVANWQTWFYSAVGYLAADLAFGTDPFFAILLNVNNLLGVLVGYLLLSRLPISTQRLEASHSVLYLFVISAAAASVSAAVGALGMTLYLGRSFWPMAETWFVAELVSAILVMPVILCLPGDRPQAFDLRGSNAERTRPARGLAYYLPMLSLALSKAVGGPGALAFLVPTLLWCALSYSVLMTAVLTLLACSWQLVVLSLGAVTLGRVSFGEPLEVVSPGYLVSLRLGIVLIALVPLTVAVVNRQRAALMRKLEMSVRYDALTHVLNRGAFLHEADSLLRGLGAEGKFAAILKIDVDQFKRINERYGHTMGDYWLIEFCETVRTKLRAQDRLGRIGGEEFAIVLPYTTFAAANLFAEDILQSVRQIELRTKEDDVLKMKISIGLAYTESLDKRSADWLLVMADSALYDAKAAGGDRLISWDDMGHADVSSVERASIKRALA